MTRLLALGYALSVVATLCAWAVARSRAEHRPIAALLTLGLASDLARRAIRLLILAPARAQLGDAPYPGWVRAAFHVESALFLVWPMALAAVAVIVYLGSSPGRPDDHITRRPWPIALLYIALVVTLAAGYPTLRGPLLGRIYLAVELGALLVSVGAFIQWFWRREGLGLTRACGLFVIAIEAVSCLGPFRLGIFAAWPLAEIGYTALYAVLIFLHGGALWIRPSTSNSS